MWTQALEPLAPELFWILCVAFVIAFLLAFSVGANDVSNSFGTSVGSKVLTVTQACILATFFEVAGATLLGYSVCDTFRQSVYDVTLFENSQKELMLGALSCLIGSAAWNMVATALKMPISGTHSIVGATIGFSVVLRGWESIKWRAMIRIVSSWFASPLLSGLISSIIYLLISKTILTKEDPLESGLKALPLFYGLTIAINIASVVIQGPAVLGINLIPWYIGLLISKLAGGIAIACVAFLWVPKLRKKITEELRSKPDKRPTQGAPKQPGPQQAESLPPTSGFDNKAFKPDVAPTLPTTKRAEIQLSPAKLQETTFDRSMKPVIAAKPAHLMASGKQGAPLEWIDLNSDEEKSSTKKPIMLQGERLEVFRLFSSLQILTACFASFAHGTNDVSNAVAPLIPIWNIYAYGYEDIHQQTQIWILALGGIGICTGLWAWGRAVMSTVGTGLTQLTPSKGFAIELGAAISVLCATKLGLPISTTHCKVGSVVIVGLVSAKFCSQPEADPEKASKECEESKPGPVDWKLFGNIALTWIVTVPLAAMASALVMVILRWLLL